MSSKKKSTEEITNGLLTSFFEAEDEFNILREFGDLSHFDCIAIPHLFNTAADLLKKKYDLQDHELKLYHLITLLPIDELRKALALDIKSQNLHLVKNLFEERGLSMELPLSTENEKIIDTILEELDNGKNLNDAIKTHDTLLALQHLSIRLEDLGAKIKFPLSKEDIETINSLSYRIFDTEQFKDLAEVDASKTFGRFNETVKELNLTVNIPFIAEDIKHLEILQEHLKPYEQLEKFFTAEYGLVYLSNISEILKRTKIKVNFPLDDIDAATISALEDIVLGSVNKFIEKSYDVEIGKKLDGIDFKSMLSMDQKLKAPAGKFKLAEDTTTYVEAFNEDALLMPINQYFHHSRTATSEEIPDYWYLMAAKTILPILEEKYNVKYAGSLPLFYLLQLEERDLYKYKEKLKSFENENNSTFFRQRGFGQSWRIDTAGENGCHIRWSFKDTLKKSGFRLGMVFEKDFLNELINKANDRPKTRLTRKQVNENLLLTLPAFYDIARIMLDPENSYYHMIQEVQKNKNIFDKRYKDEWRQGEEAFENYLARFARSNPSYTKKAEFLRELSCFSRKCHAVIREVYGIEDPHNMYMYHVVSIPMRMFFKPKHGRTEDTTLEVAYTALDQFGLLLDSPVPIKTMNKFRDDMIKRLEEAKKTEWIDPEDKRYSMSVSYFTEQVCEKAEEILGNREYVTPFKKAMRVMQNTLGQKALMYEIARMSEKDIFQIKLDIGFHEKLPELGPLSRTLLRKALNHYGLEFGMHFSSEDIEKITAKKPRARKPAREILDTVIKMRSQIPFNHIKTLAYGDEASRFLSGTFEVLCDELVRRNDITKGYYQKSLGKYLASNNINKETVDQITSETLMEYCLKVIDDLNHLTKFYAPQIRIPGIQLSSMMNANTFETPFPGSELMFFDGSNPATANKQIMLIGDFASCKLPDNITTETTNIEALKKYLFTQRYDVEWHAENGTQALNILQNLKDNNDLPAFILVDGNIKLADEFHLDDRLNGITSITAPKNISTERTTGIKDILITPDDGELFKTIISNKYNLKILKAGDVAQEYAESFTARFGKPFAAYEVEWHIKCKPVTDINFMNELGNTHCPTFVTLDSNFKPDSDSLSAISKNITKAFGVVIPQVDLSSEGKGMTDIILTANGAPFYHGFSKNDNFDIITPGEVANSYAKVFTEQFGEPFSVKVGEDEVTRYRKPFVAYEIAWRTKNKMQALDFSNATDNDNKPLFSTLNNFNPKETTAFSSLDNNISNLTGIIIPNTELSLQKKKEQHVHLVSESYTLLHALTNMGLPAKIVLASDMSNTMADAIKNRFGAHVMDNNAKEIVKKMNHAILNMHLISEYGSFQERRG